jgi:hypothetical protein
MMIAHELGHMLHAWLSGGRIAAVAIPLFGFSQTSLRHNPHPGFVAWGGAIWGVIIPMCFLAAARAARWRIRSVMQFFAGFCLIANGVYLGVGSFGSVGDAGDLLRHGSPRWTLILYGLGTIPLGFLLWHGLGSFKGVFRGRRSA